jgi:glycerate kinase
VIRAAAAKGAKRCFIGIGGSATNDASFGMARALGWEFLDGAGNSIASWTGLDKLVELRPPRRTKWFAELVVAVDVRNPLLGARGCTRFYGPQKGLAAADFKIAERCLRRLALVAKRQLKRDCASEPGAGAAGGLGFGLRCFLGARLQPGFDLIARQTDLDRRLRAADLVITGEGAIDASTLMGKGVGELAARCFKLGVPCIGLGGALAVSRDRKQKYFARLHGLTDLTNEKNARRHAAFWLERLARRVAEEFSQKSRAKNAKRGEVE